MVRNTIKFYIYIELLYGRSSSFIPHPLPTPCGKDMNRIQGFGYAPVQSHPPLLVCTGQYLLTIKHIIFGGSHGSESCSHLRTAVLRQQGAGGHHHSLQVDPDI
jgi:hypothetical protein